MTKNFNKLDNEGYCENCQIYHNCYNCYVINNLIHYNLNLNKVLDEKETNNVICGECGNAMVKKKGKSKGEQFWCPKCSKK